MASVLAGKLWCWLQADFDPCHKVLQLQLLHKQTHLVGDQRPPVSVLPWYLLVTMGDLRSSFHTRAVQSPTDRKNLG